MNNEYERKEEIEPGEIPTILAMGVIVVICVYALIRFCNA